MAQRSIIEVARIERKIFNSIKEAEAQGLQRSDFANCSFGGFRATRNSQEDIDVTADHISRRESFAGRWLPAFFYLVNYLLWVFAAQGVLTPGLLWLAVFPLLALVLYLIRTGRKSRGA